MIKSQNCLRNGSFKSKKLGFIRERNRQCTYPLYFFVQNWLYQLTRMIDCTFVSVEYYSTVVIFLKPNCNRWYKNLHKNNMYKLFMYYKITYIHHFINDVCENVWDEIKNSSRVQSIYKHSLLSSFIFTRDTLGCFYILGSDKRVSVSGNH